METVETVETPLSLVSESAAESANVESAAAVPVDSSIAAAALNTFNVHPCAIVNATTIMSGNMEEEVPPLSSAPRADATDASTTTDAGSAREDTANGQASLSINRVDTAISSTRTNTQRRTASWDHGTSSPSSGDNAESEAVASVHHSDHAAATTTEMTTTTTLSNSLETSTHATDKDGSAYVQALLSAIATVPATDNVLAGRAATSSGDAVYRLPNGQVITSKNTLQSHSTAATGSNSSNRRSDSDHGDEGESHHVRGVPVPSTPLSATASPILVSVVHVTQDHAGTASSSPPILAAVVADTNEPIDHGTATGGDNDDASKSRVKKLRIFAVVVFAILLIAVSLFATFYWIKAGKYQATSFRKFTAPLPVQCRS